MFYTIINNLFDDSRYGYGEQKSEKYNTGNAEFCEDCKVPLSMLEWLPPYELKVSKTDLGDFVFGTYTGFIVSEEFKKLYQTSDLVGLSEFKEVDVYYKNKKLQERYFYPKISLINAFVNLDLVEFDSKNLCGTCQKGNSIINKIYGVEFVNSQVIKEDIFFTTSLGQAQLFVSDKFKKAVEKENFKNLILLNSSQYEWDSLSPPR